MDYVKQVPRKVKIKEGKVIKRKQKNTMAIQLFEESVRIQGSGVRICTSEDVWITRLHGIFILFISTSLKTHKREGKYSHFRNGLP